MRHPEGFLHKTATFFDNTAAHLFLAAPLWLAGLGVGGGIVAAPMLGVGVVAAGVVGGVAGFVSGACNYMAMGSEKNGGIWRIFGFPADIVAGPVKVLGETLHTVALSREISPVNKKRIKDAFNKAVIPSLKARWFLNSGRLYADVARDVNCGRGSAGGIALAIEKKIYPLYRGRYKP